MPIRLIFDDKEEIVVDSVTGDLLAERVALDAYVFAPLFKFREGGKPPDNLSEQYSLLTYLQEKAYATGLPYNIKLIGDLGGLRPVSEGKGFDPNQPRYPAGDSRGGQFKPTDGSSSGTDDNGLDGTEFFMDDGPSLADTPERRAGDPRSGQFKPAGLQGDVLDADGQYVPLRDQYADEMGPEETYFEALDIKPKKFDFATEAVQKRHAELTGKIRRSDPLPAVSARSGKPIEYLHQLIPENVLPRMPFTTMESLQAFLTLDMEIPEGSKLKLSCVPDHMNPDTWKISAEVTSPDPDDDALYFITRSFNYRGPDNLKPQSADAPKPKFNHVHNDYFALRDDLKDSGYGMDLIVRQAQFLKDNNFKLMTLNADIDVGKYAWAQMGYDDVEFLPDKYPVHPDSEPDYHMASRKSRASFFQDWALEKIEREIEYEWKPGLDIPNAISRDLNLFNAKWHAKRMADNLAKLTPKKFANMTVTFKGVSLTGKEFLLSKESDSWDGFLELEDWKPEMYRAREEFEQNLVLKSAGEPKVYNCFQATPEIKAEMLAKGYVLQDREMWATIFNDPSILRNAYSSGVTEKALTWEEDEHPRDPDGRFAQKMFKIVAGKFDRLPPESRVWQGKQETPTAGVVQPSKLKAGEVGEQIVTQVLSALHDTAFGTLNVDRNNMPVDVIGDHWAVEVKVGMASNGPKAQQWRATIGEPGPAEKELLARMGAEEKLRHNAVKREKILERKRNMVRELEKLAGAPVSPKTVTCILSADQKRMDIFMFDDFHLRLGWKEAATDDNYLGTFEVA